MEPTEQGFACEAPDCKVDGMDRDDLCEAEDGSLWCREHFPAPPLVIELWYEDGDVGAYEAEEEDRPHVEYLWRLFSQPRNGHGPARILVRRDDKEAQEASPELILRNMMEEIAELRDPETGEWDSTDWVGNSLALEQAMKFYGKGRGNTLAFPRTD